MQWRFGDNALSGEGIRHAQAYPKMTVFVSGVYPLTDGKCAQSVLVRSSLLAVDSVQR